MTIIGKPLIPVIFPLAIINLGALKNTPYLWCHLDARVTRLAIVIAPLPCTHIFKFIVSSPQNTNNCESSCTDINLVLHQEVSG